MPLPHPLAWLRHRRLARTNGRYLRAVLDEDDRAQMADAGLRGARAGATFRQALDAAEDFDTALRNLRATCGVDPADLEDFREQLIDLTNGEHTRAR